jgi:predicted nucleic acid-binding protein
MGSRRALDTNAVLYMFSGRLQVPLEPEEYVVSIITEIELLSFPALTPATEAEIRAFLSDVDLIELTPEIKERAILVRRRHRLKLPDAIIAATAMEMDAELVTNDARFAAVEGLGSVQLKLKPG